MTDSPDPSRLLASAALDNEATADERARVTASESLTAEVESYRTLRAELADIQVPTVAREAAITAALAVFDTIHASPVAPSLAPVVSLAARRQRQYRWIGGAAAAAVVALVGVVVIKTATQDDHKSVSLPSTTVFTAATAAGATDSIALESAAADASGAANQTAGTTAASTAGSAAPDLADAVPADSSATDSPLPAAGTPPVTTAAATAPPPTSDPWAQAPTFASPGDLLAYASVPGSPLSKNPAATTTTIAPTFQSTAATTAASTAETTAATAAATAATGSTSAKSSSTDLRVCTATLSAPSVPVVYEGQRVIAVRNDATGQFEIIDPTTCTIISTIPIP